MSLDVSSTQYKKLQSKGNSKRSTDESVELYDFDAEQSLLGGVILFSHRIESITGIITSKDFYYNEHRILFSTIESLITAGKSINVLEIVNDLQIKGKLSDVGGQAAILALTNAVPSTVDLTRYAQIIADKARAREMLSVCDYVTNLIYHPNGRTIEDVYNEAEQKVFALTEKAVSSASGPEKMTEICKRLISELKDNFGKAKKDGVMGVDTGYTMLNQMTSGFHGGELIIIAARPGVGKTTFAMNLVENISMRHTLPALVFSLEMPSSHIAQRLMASMARIDHEKLKTFNLTDQDLATLLQTFSSIVSRDVCPIYIDDSSELSPSELRTKARRLYKEFGGLSCIMVDYVQLMHVPGYDANNRHLEVSQCSHSLKALAKELNVPVIALAQINRGVEQRKDRKPMNSDLRESGALEQDADMILFVHREDMYEKDNPEVKGKAQIIIGKQRNGPTGIIDMAFLGNYSRFEGLDNIHTL